MTGALLNECHLVDFLDCGYACTDLRQPAFAQRSHPFFPRGSLDFRSGAAVHNHFANAIGEIHQFTNGRTAVVARARALQASNAFHDGHIPPHRGIKAEFFQVLGSVLLRPLAIWANNAHQALGQDAVQRGDKVVWLNTHVHETANHVRHIVGVNSGKDEVAGESRLNGDLRGFLVADFANHDFVRVVAKNRSKASRKSEALFLIDRNLRDAANLVFDRILDGNEFVVIGFDFINGCVQSGGLAGARGSGDQDHAVRLMNVAAETLEFFRGKTDYVQIEVRKLLRKCLFVQHAKNRVFAVAGWHDGHTQVDIPTFILYAEAAILGNAALGNVQFAQNLDARKHRGVMLLSDGLHGVLQHAVNAVLHGDFGVTGFDVDVAGAPLECGKDDGLDEANYGACGTVTGQAIAGDGLFGFFFFLAGLESKRLGGLFENALRLLGALEKVAYLAGCCYAD